MTKLGFWNIAEAEPDRIAVIDVDHSEHTYGDVAAEAQERRKVTGELGEKRNDLVQAGDGFDEAALREEVGSISPDTPVLLMTAYAQPQSRQAHSRAAPELILKPLVLTELLSKIQQILDQKTA